MVGIVVCGYGTIGRKVVDELLKANADFSVIDKNENVFRGKKIRFVIGDAASEEVLRKAGIERANVLVTCADRDDANLFTILAAKKLNKNLRVFSIGKKSRSITTLHKAGADGVISISATGGRAIAKHAIVPHVAEFVDRIALSKDVQITDLNITKKSRLVNVQLRNSRIRESTGVSIVAIRRGRQLVPNPPANTVLHANEKLIVIGNKEQIKALSRITKGV
jgi:voltage-gated potassium channel